MVVAHLRLEVARRRGAPDFPFVGKFNTTPARCVPLAATRVVSRSESDLSMKSGLVALSTTIGEGLYEMEKAPIGVHHGPSAGGD